MSFNPLVTSQNIRDAFRRYIVSTFKTNSPKYNAQLKELLSGNECIIKGPYLQISHNFPTGNSIPDLVNKGVLSPEFLKFGYEPFEKNKLYKHQETAISKVLEGKNIVVSTGTGSGKTECFLIPILNDLLREKERGTLGDGVRVMLLYPMNALANDQLERMRDILANYKDITFGVFNSETEEDLESALEKDGDSIERPVNEVYDRTRFRLHPPHILITNYAMLEHLLIKPNNNPLFGTPGQNHWKFIVLDEAHTYGGAKGSEVSMLLRRLRTTLGKKDIHFILTSATLGSEDADEEVADFASRLCSSEFLPDSIIRSKYVPMVLPDNPIDLDPEFYEGAADIINSQESDVTEELKDYLADYGYSSGDVREYLYDMVYRDRMIHRISDALDGGPKVVSDLATELNCDESLIFNIVTTISATKKLRNRVFDAKFHLFIKGVSGAYVTLRGSEKLFLEPRKEYEEEDGKKYKVFQASTCYSCGAIYLLGNKDKNKLTQVSRQSEEFTGYHPFLLMNDVTVDRDGDDWKTYLLCSECGQLLPGGTRCMCGSTNLNGVIEIQEKEKLCTCPVCGNRDTRRGLLRQLYLGDESSTAVIASTLYNDLLNGKDSRFITFSDNRQAAAFFAPYMQDTYDGILMKRTIYEVICRNTEELTEGTDFDRFCDLVGRTAAKKKLLNRKQTLDAIIKECGMANSYRSMEYLGFLRFDYARGKNDKEWKPTGMYGLSEGEVYNLINSLVKYARNKRAVTYDSTDFEPYEFRRGYRLDDTSDGSARFFNDQIKAYLMKIIGSEEDAREFADKFIKGMLSTEEGCPGKLLDLARLDVFVPTKVYRCKKCKSQFPFSVRNICIKCCEETLEEIPVNAVAREIDGKYLERNLDLSNHYVNTCVESPLHKFVIKEHTAQLDSKQAWEYQHEFREKEIDALSCSTTFEMGVDIGSLSAVMMRNMPPSPSNYIQRAGRAGRGEDSSAFAVTYCKETSHDVTYYHDPLSMISGQINVPIVKTDNVPIILRHVFASAFAFYWKLLGEYPRTVEKFVEQYDGFKEYLAGKPEPLKEYLYEIVPADVADQEFGIDIAGFGWTEVLFEGTREEHARLEKAIMGYFDELGVLEESMPEITADMSDIEKIKALERHKNSIRTQGTLKHTQTLSFLSRHNLIPRYGFPSDVVSMIPASGKSTTDLSRSLSVAVSEFAPGAEVIADGRKVMSRYITKIRHGNDSWLQYRYVQCGECGKMNILIDNSLPDNDRRVVERLSRCSCGRELDPDIRKFIIPEMGFKYIDSRTPIIEKPVKSYAQNVSFCDSYDAPSSFQTIGSETIQLIPIINGRLAVVNDSHYFVCSRCGYAEKIATFVQKRKKGHLDSKGKMCYNETDLKSKDLGYIFRTDILAVRFISKSCTDLKITQSVLYALIEGFCREFKIERTEVGGCLDNVDGGFSFILYDDTQGGSGYVKIIDGKEPLLRMIRTAYRVVKDCTCGGETGDTSCYHCLRNYRNQRIHDDLIRKNAIDFFESLDLGGDDVL